MGGANLHRHLEMVFDNVGPTTMTLFKTVFLRPTYGPLSEPQGEAIAYDASGTGLWTVSEDPEGEEPQPLHHFRCE